MNIFVKRLVVIRKIIAQFLKIKYKESSLEEYSTSFNKIISSSKIIIVLYKIFVRSNYIEIQNYFIIIFSKNFYFPLNNNPLENILITLAISFEVCLFEKSLIRQISKL